MTEIFKVENIKCGGCMNSIKTALLKINNVSTVDIDKETDSISVNGNAMLDRKKIAQKLANLGYPEKGENTILHQAKSFVSCAIGNITEKK